MVKLNLEIPHGFLDEEVRSGYVVTSDMKAIWAVELDLLAELDKMCRNYNLRYCVAAGTLLGAIRHRGFIPWDDDIDIYMLRKDYDQLMILANQFTFPYFLQSTYTEKKLYRPHAQLRNSNTTGYIDEDKYRDINKGIFIDIFPLDGVSELEEENRKQRKIYDRYNRILSRFNTAMDYKPETSIIKNLKKIKERNICCY